MALFLFTLIQWFYFLVSTRAKNEFTVLIKFSNVSRSEPLLPCFFEEGLDIGAVRIEVPLGNRISGDDDFSSRIGPIGDSVVSFFPVDESDLETGHRFADGAGRQVVELHHRAGAARFRQTVAWNRKPEQNYYENLNMIRSHPECFASCFAKQKFSVGRDTDMTE